MSLTSSVVALTVQTRGETDVKTPAPLANSIVFMLNVGVRQFGIVKSGWRRFKNNLEIMITVILCEINVDTYGEDSEMKRLGEAHVWLNVQLTVIKSFWLLKCLLNRKHRYVRNIPIKARKRYQSLTI